MRRREWFACPSCHRVVPQLFRARWSVGFDDLEPRHVCERCLDALRDEEQRHRDGLAIGDAVWAVQVLDTVGEPLVRTPAAENRSTNRESRGGVKV